MQFLINVVDDGQATAAGATDSATQDERDAVDAFNQRLVADGVFVFAAGVSAPAEAVVLDARGAAPTRSDGPLVGGVPSVAGFWVWEVDDRATALRLAAEASTACNRRIEVRQLLGPE